MFAISPTDLDWFKSLKQNGFNSSINFWTPTPWKIKTLKQGSRLYFLLKSPIRRCAGYGEFTVYKELNINSVWFEFGKRNGCESKDILHERIKNYRRKNSKRYIEEHKVENHKIGCLILDNCEFWEEKDFIDLKDVGVSFPPQIVTIKFFNGQDNLRAKASKKENNFNLIEGEKDKVDISSVVRKGQSKFKKGLLNAYANKCCISGETIPELLEAAHIQPYINITSNHIQNGLLLRTDLHKLFDNDLLYIDEEYKVHLSSLIQSKEYTKYEGIRIQLPENKNYYPSITALQQRKESYRRVGK